MKITLITCACYRPDAWTLCEKYFSRQTRQPDQWIVLDDDIEKTVCTRGQLYIHNPEWRGKYSMQHKVLYAIESGIITGDILVFGENDDYYAPTWLEWCAKHLERYDLVGQGSAFYYHVGKRWWSDCKNIRHASLCQTAITRGMFEKVANTIRGYWSPFFDTRIWTLNCRKYLHLPATEAERLVIGIKGMPGLSGYSAEHQQINPLGSHLDPQFERLPQLIGEDAEAYRKFYVEPPPMDMTPYSGKVEVHILCFNEADILPYALSHYKTFASRIVVHDGGSTDGSQAIAESFGAEVHFWDTVGKLNDGMAVILKNTCWKGTDADWVICVDADELIYFPAGAHETLSAYSREGRAVIKPHGFEMFSEVYPTTSGQIYDEVKMGARDDKWYAKPALFSPRRVAETGFGVGGHESAPLLKDDSRLYLGINFPKADPPTYLLHYHQIGPADRLAARYDSIRKRYSDVNERHQWGNYTPGALHVQQKRDYILPRLEQVIP